MSSLTDIIFLLLIFFMLTSNFVKISPIDLPESSSTTVAPTNIVVQIEKNGKIQVNNKQVRMRGVDAAVRKIVRELGNEEGATINIVAEKGVHFEKVTQVIKVAQRLRIRAILATQPPK